MCSRLWPNVVTPAFVSGMDNAILSSSEGESWAVANGGCARQKLAYADLDSCWGIAVKAQKLQGLEALLLLRSSKVTQGLSV